MKIKEEMKMHKLLFVPVSFVIFLYVLALPVKVDAQVELSAPEKVARGDAFLARASSSQPVDKFVFYWKGRSFPVNARYVQGEGGQKIGVGEILLPVPLDEAARAQKLGVGTQMGNDRPAPASVHVPIQFFDKQRPVQRLKVDKKYVHPPASEEERIKNDRKKVQAALQENLPERLWEMPFKRPVPGQPSSLFGMKRVFNGEPRSVHKGLDLRGASGTPIHAMADGRVALVDNLYYSGNTVYLNHRDGVFSAYLHMSEPKVKEGQMVKKGDVIGLVGATGRVTGPHLHLSMIVQGQSVDPQPFVDHR